MPKVEADYTMHSFTLKTQGFTLEERLGILKGAYLSALKDDPNWHFFFEAEYGDFVRVSEEFVPVFIAYLIECEIEFTEEEFWQEQYEFVSRNFEYFKKLFHLNSEFAMTYEDDADFLLSWLNGFVERYSHSLHDMLHIVLDGDVLERESGNLSRAALNRSFYDGYRAYYLRNR